VEGFKYKVFRAALNTLYFSGAYRALRPLLGGVGAILMLHHVRPSRSDRFQPNHLLEVTPRFFETVIRRLRRSKVDLISLDEMHRRLTTGDYPRRRFVCVTFDDGYRDNLQFAYPVLKKYEVPFTIYVATSFADRIGELWWLALEAVVARNPHVGLLIDGKEHTFDCRTTAEKRDVYDALYGWLRRLATEQEVRVAVRDLSRRYHVDIAAFCNDLCMDWGELNRLAADPLVTIGAHTVNHVMLAKVPEATARSEMAMSRSVIEAALGSRPDHLSYPVGDKTSAAAREFKIAAELGFKTAVTTRPGVLFPEHRDHFMCLPRISLNGEHQQLRYVRVLLSGAATAVWNRFRRVDAA